MLATGKSSLYCYPSWSINLFKQILTNLFYVRWPESFLYRFIKRLNRFFKAFSVLPYINLEISDHFFDPYNYRTYSNSFLSSWRDQGPFWIEGLRKQFQCYLHCLAVRNTLLLDEFFSYNFSETSFQLILSTDPTASRRSLSYCFDHLWVISFTFLRLNHLNLHFCHDDPEISADINSQSVFC